ncbi:histone-lysine N-methyltransferase SETMAR [Trichonephila clavipes]|nr:histone-lysine N-methyltransferase SETMAR [Trichonephila clavipes]
MEVNKEKIRFFLQFSFDKGENASQVAEIVNGVDTVTANYVQFWFRRFRSGIFYVKDAPRTGGPIVENFDKIIEIFEVHRHVSSRSIAQELKIDHKNVLSHLRKLDRLKLAFDQKRPKLANRRGVVFYEDNVRTHTSVVIRQNLWELGWKVLMHPPFSPDLVPSDYHLFFALQNFFSDKKLGSREDWENRLLDVFVNKGQDFYETGIMKLTLK